MADNVTEINLNSQFDHSAAASRMGKVKADPCSRMPSPAGKLWMVTKDEEEVAASSGASIGRSGIGVTVLEQNGEECNRFNLKSSHLFKDLL